MHNNPPVTLHQGLCGVEMFVLTTRMFVIFSGKYCIACLYTSVRELEVNSTLFPYFDKMQEKHVTVNMNIKQSRTEYMKGSQKVPRSMVWCTVSLYRPGERVTGHYRMQVLQRKRCDKWTAVCASQ
jgi:hypothetical protein